MSKQTEKKYIVLADGLGFGEGGYAKKDEIVTESQIGTDNIQRLMEGGIIYFHHEEPTREASEPTVTDPVVNAQPVTTDEKDKAPAATPPADPPAPEVEPEDVKIRLSLGLKPKEGVELTPEETAWISEVQEGVEPVPFNSDKVLTLGPKEIAKRIGSFTGTEPNAVGVKKSDLAEALKQAITEWFANYEVKAT